MQALVVPKTAWISMKGRDRTLAGPGGRKIERETVVLGDNLTEL